MAFHNHTLAPLLQKLELRSRLDEEDRAAFLSLPHRVQRREAGVCIIRDGDRPDHSCVLLSGFVIRSKVTEMGERQIVGVHVPGDFVDLEGALLDVVDHNVHALTRCQLAIIPRAAVRELILANPNIATSLWIDTLIDGATYREWIVNVGRRDARARIAHLLCELARRMEAAGMAAIGGYELPMTQEQIADATGLTSVHVNRVLKRLDAEGLIVRSRRHMSIPDWERLRDAAGFNDSYLHLDQKTAQRLATHGTAEVAAAYLVN